MYRCHALTSFLMLLCQLHLPACDQVGCFLMQFAISVCIWTIQRGCTTSFMTINARPINSCRVLHGSSRPAGQVGSGQSFWIVFLSTYFNSWNFRPETFPVSLVCSLAYNPNPLWTCCWKFHAYAHCDCFEIFRFSLTSHHFLLTQLSVCSHIHNLNEINGQYIRCQKVLRSAGHDCGEHFGSGWVENLKGWVRSGPEKWTRGQLCYSLIKSGLLVHCTWTLKVTRNSRTNRLVGGPKLQYIYTVRLRVLESANIL